MASEYSQGICQDGAAILKDGRPMTIEEILAELRAAPQLDTVEPAAIEYQHEDTGQIGYIDVQQVEWGFFQNNPRLQQIGPVYRHPPAQPDTVAVERDERAEFEEWAGPFYGVIPRETQTGQYDAWDTQTAWEAWQARALLDQEKP